MHHGRRRIGRRVRVGCQRFPVVGRCGDYVDGRLELARGIRAAAKRRDTIARVLRYRRCGERGFDTLGGTRGSHRPPVRRGRPVRFRRRSCH